MSNKKGYPSQLYKDREEIRIAIKNKDDEALKRLLEWANQKKLDLNYSYEADLSPLHYALLNNNVPAVKMLFEYVAIDIKIYIPGIKRLPITPMEYAYDQGYDDEILHLFLPQRPPESEERKNEAEISASNDTETDLSESPDISPRSLSSSPSSHRIATVFSHHPKELKLEKTQKYCTIL